MMHIWALERSTVSQILDRYGKERPPHSTISSVVRILEKKGFVDHKAYGRTHEYFPLIEKKDYKHKSIKKLVLDYFEGSTENLVSFLVKEEEIDRNEIELIINALEKKDKR